jgi:hypothetical protein
LPITRLPRTVPNGRTSDLARGQAGCLIEGTSGYVAVYPPAAHGHGGPERRTSAQVQRRLRGRLPGGEHASDQCRDDDQNSSNHFFPFSARDSLNN